MATDEFIQTAASTRYDTSSGQELLPIAKDAAYIVPTAAPKGIGGFIFNIVTDDTVDLSSQITDHYTENNVAMQDHIALDAVRVTVRGLVGEIESMMPTATQRSVALSMANVPDAMAADPSLGKNGTGGNNAMYTAIIKSASDNYNKIEKQKNTDINREQVGSIYSVFRQKVSRPTNQSKQEYIFRFFYTSWRSKMLFTVETPWGIFDKMAIERIHVNQAADTRFASDFTLTFKQIRTAKDVMVMKAAGRAADQVAATETAGTQQTVDTPKPTAASVNTNPASPAATPTTSKIVQAPKKWYETAVDNTVKWVVAKGVTR